MTLKENRVACIQLTSSDDLKQNLLATKALIQEAAEGGAKLVVLPEMFALMGLDQMDKIKHKEILGEGPIQDFLQEQAIKHTIWLVGGTIPIAVPADENKIYASCLVFNNQGERVACYNKIHLFDVSLNTHQEVYRESRSVAPGNQIVVIKTPFGKLGLAVCYDVRFPELFRAMHEYGVEIIALPAAFTSITGAMHWDVLVRARAIENLVYILAACQTGTHTNSRKTYGHSMIVNPWGEVQIGLSHNPGVIVAEVNLESLHQIRKEFPVLSHGKKFLSS